MTNGNPDLFENVKSAVIKGFDLARAVFGGWLPEVSERTIDLVMKGLDEMFAVDQEEESPEPVESEPQVTV